MVEVDFTPMPDDLDWVYYWFIPMTCTQQDCHRSIHQLSHALLSVLMILCTIVRWTDAYFGALRTRA